MCQEALLFPMNYFLSDADKKHIFPWPILMKVTEKDIFFHSAFFIVSDKIFFLWYVIFSPERHQETFISPLLIFLSEDDKKHFSIEYFLSGGERRLYLGLP